MKTRDKPHGIVGFDFAQALLSGNYATAHALLSPELKAQYPILFLKQTFEEMMSLAHEPGELPEVEVLDNTFLGDASLDDKGWAYVAIWTEAVTVTVQAVGEHYLITDLMWGRP
ncbi:MAG TPA: hypothetical protein VJU82_17715 [Acidobacteriaceae bacterium]|nr:hypothetical protein [Acidobacteriaceae bacterium]